MDDEEEAIQLIWIESWGWLEVANLESKKENRRNNNKKAQKPYIGSSHYHVKTCVIVRIGPKEENHVVD